MIPWQFSLGPKTGRKLKVTEATALIKTSKPICTNVYFFIPLLIFYQPLIPSPRQPLMWKVKLMGEMCRKQHKSKNWDSCAEHWQPLENKFHTLNHTVPKSLLWFNKNVTNTDSKTNFSVARSQTEVVHMNPRENERKRFFPTHKAKHCDLTTEDGNQTEIISKGSSLWRFY